MSSVAESPAARAPTPHAPGPGTYVPRDSLWKRYVTPAGRESVTATVLASSGPRFRSVTEYWISEPSGGVGLLTVFVISRSAPPTVTEAESASFAPFGSG